MISYYLRLIRPYQYIKNILIFPLFILSFNNVYLIAFYWVEICLMFIAFCFAASSIYIINDVVDAKSDKNHSFKKLRPIAAGKISKKNAILLSFFLFIISTCTSIFLSIDFLLIIGVYIALNFFYTFVLKKIIFIDVICLTFFYLLRICSPAILDNINISYWFICVSFFLFLSLAFLKRYIDLAQIDFYKEYDNNLVKNYFFSSGQTLSLISVVFFVSYLNSYEFQINYEQSLIIYFIVPISVYWFFNLWFNAKLSKITKDPILFVFTNRNSLLCILFSFICLIVSR